MGPGDVPSRPARYNTACEEKEGKSAGTEPLGQLSCRCKLRVARPLGRSNTAWVHRTLSRPPYTAGATDPWIANLLRDQPLFGGCEPGAAVNLDERVQAVPVTVRLVDAILGL